MDAIKLTPQSAVEFEGKLFAVKSYSVGEREANVYLERVAGFAVQQPARKPFDLEAAKAGKPIVTKKGKPVKFIAHIPEADSENRVIAFPEESSSALDYNEDGKSTFGGRDSALFMLAQKKTVYVNFYDTIGHHAYHHDTPNEAQRWAGGEHNGMKPFAVAVPVEVEV